MVTLKTIDRLIGLLAIGVVLFGSYSWWRATRQALARDGMMGQMMETVPGMTPVWYLFGTLIAVSVVLGVYVTSRKQLADMLSTSTPAGTAAANRDESDTSTGPHSRSSERASEQSSQELSMDGSSSERPSALTLLPEDERRIIEPILESPGLTQVELRGRSDFSKAKVSQSVSELEDRGLIYREKQGRTYRVYPGELLKERYS
ncbi:helix-turn-helix transcriptional regulator [Halomarina halobia]|uniref:Helix-turn-helix transcriptional regulator n=1 Tax=Halomarina halobia TaxID=3033386 RepID=A0ABD6AF18_9EURY|nr:MarR family transcriptional regulator [Halomarina sp. PSR21]